MILLLLLMMLLELLQDFDYLALALLVDIVRLILYFQCISYRIHIHLYCVFGVVFNVSIVLYSTTLVLCSMSVVSCLWYCIQC